MGEAFPEVAGTLLLEQNFANLEEAMEAELWEVDGDDLQLYACEPGGPSEDGPPGAVLVTEGKSDGWAELVHSLAGGAGARVCRLTSSFICESLDNDSAGSFTVGLAFNEDLEESSLLALTLRRTRENPGEDESGLVRPIELHVNGALAVADVLPLPVRADLEVELCWDAMAPGGRRVRLLHRLSQVALSGGASGSTSDGVAALAEEVAAVAAPVTEVVAAAAGAAGAAATAEDGRPGETIVDFYTTGDKFDKATALYFRSTGKVKVRLLHVACHHEEPT
mmetsp:Transcript_34553/g.109369  ORF Transcript_34553/g.109369 Transcript_34553/m.109369 type:complete len:280 (-) Transcript_34553:44-883(-)